MTSEPPSDRGTATPELSDPGLARDRTALAWTRSALNMAASGTLIARAAFMAHLDALGLASALTIAAIAVFTWRHGQAIYHERYRSGMPPRLQTGEFVGLTVATVLTATIAMLVSIVI